MRPFLPVVFSLLLIATVSGQKQITIFHTNNVNGKLQNCLCSDQPYGGLEKMTYIIKEERAKNKNVLVLDAGDFFSPFETMERNQLVVEALDIVKYDVQALGDQEFAYGPTFFDGKVLGRGHHYISANLTIAGTPIVPKDKIVKVGEVRIAICSVISPDAFRFYPEAKIIGIEISDPAEAIQSWLDRTKGKADLFILLSHLGYDDDNKMAGKFGQINLIIGGHSQEIIDEPKIIGNTHIVQTGGDAFYLGKLLISFSADKEIYQVDYELIPMELNLPNDKEVAALAIKYDFSFIAKALPRINNYTPLDSKYLTVSLQVCGDCHENEYESWKENLHTESWKKIDEKSKSKVHNCVGCHVTGYGREEGFININLTKDMGAVTCTECHYTEKAHLKKKDKATVAKIKEATCVRCHDTDNDPDFNYQDALKKIRHK